MTDERTHESDHDRRTHPNDTMTCPFLEYRRSDDSHEFDHERPYCAITEAFVSPMRADICNDRHGFDHAEQCEWYREAFGDDAAEDQSRNGA